LCGLLLDWGKEGVAGYDGTPWLDGGHESIDPRPRRCEADVECGVAWCGRSPYFPLYRPDQQHDPYIREVRIGNNTATASPRSPSPYGPSVVVRIIFKFQNSNQRVLGCHACRIHSRKCLDNVRDRSDMGRSVV
jgi:hypothetical protein